MSWCCCSVEPQSEVNGVLESTYCTSLPVVPDRKHFCLINPSLSPSLAHPFLSLCSPPHVHPRPPPSSLSLRRSCARCKAALPDCGLGERRNTAAGSKRNTAGMPAAPRQNLMCRFVVARRLGCLQLGPLAFGAYIKMKQRAATFARRCRSD